MSSTKNIKSNKPKSSSEDFSDMPAAVYDAAADIADAVQVVIDQAKTDHSAKRAREAIFSDDEDVSDLRPDAKPFIPKEDPRYKTAMCFNKSCPHGDKCTFAHSEDELRKRMCRFGDRCRNVNRHSQGWENVERAAVCTAYHPDETLDNHTYREKDFKIRQKPSVKPMIRPSPVLSAFISRSMEPETMPTFDQVYMELVDLRNEVAKLRREVAGIRR